jgi:hypothetical protein
MLNLYGANDVAAKHRYEGKRVVIDGIIHEINNRYFDIIPHGSDFSRCLALAVTSIPTASVMC